MPANLEQRGGMWIWRAKIKGQRYRRSTGFTVKGGKRSLELAQRAASEFETQVRAELRGYITQVTPTFKAWALQFLEAYYPDRPTETRILRRAVARWGDTRLDLLTRTDVELYFREREATGAAAGTRERERVLLKRLFRVATDDGRIPVNPMAEMKTIRTVPRTRVLTREEEVQLREKMPPEWQRWLTVGLLTGMRLSELCGIAPMDLRDEGRAIWVRPELNKVRKGRQIPLRPEAQEALRVQRAYRPGDDHVPYWPGNAAARAQLQRWSERLGFEPPISPHALRRTFGTRCAEAGMLLSHLQKLMGHYSPLVTARYYIHIEQASLSDALNKVTL
jgi:integrase